MTTRKVVTVPADGVTEEIRGAAGFEILVELNPDNTPSGVPVLHIDSPGGPSLPALNQAHYRPPQQFQRLYVTGTAGSAGGTLYLLIVTDRNFQFRLSSTVEA